MDHSNHSSCDLSMGGMDDMMMGGGMGKVIIYKSIPFILLSR